MVMAKKASAKPPKSSKKIERASITPERFARLNLLLTLLAQTPQTREVLARKLKLDVRGFYRDLEVLRQAGVPVVLQESHYQLTETIAAARDRLPFPDPMLTFGEVTQLAKGRTAAHRRLQELLKQRQG
jgi:predicted DNA-binding transcriptional regulator YafY